MIKENTPISMAEASGYLDKKIESDALMLGFIKKFSKIDKKDAVEMKKKLEDLEMIKLKSETVVKIIDVMPEDVDDLNKIFSGISLDEEEIKSILEIVKEFR